ncbi:MAG: HesA/MoeB/ThiF family protein [Myxococcota bacterium]
MSIEPHLGSVHFVVVGAGGLGCPALLGLSAAGARSITVLDPDVVETSNLQRQVLYGVGDVGREKAVAAAWALRRRVPSLDVKARVTALAPEDADAFVAALPDRTIVLECTDQPALKFALNDAGLRHGTPVIIGAALGLKGQCLAVVPGRACYRCIYESPPEDLPTCDGAGVLGVAVGLAGFLMATAAVALCRSPAEADETAGALTAIDTATGRIQTISPSPRPGCPACAEATDNRLFAAFAQSA